MPVVSLRPCDKDGTALVFCGGVGAEDVVVKAGACVDAVTIWLGWDASLGCYAKVYILLV